MFAGFDSYICALSDTIKNLFNLWCGQKNFDASDIQSQLSL